MTWIAAGVVVAGVAGTAVYKRMTYVAPPKLVYSAQGYGGYVPAPTTASPGKKQPQPVHAAPKPPVAVAVSSYNQGHYTEAITQAHSVIVAAQHKPTPINRKEAAFARQILAYSAARNHDLKTAQAQFATLQVEAARLPDKGVQTTNPGDPKPTLEAEAVYEHAVCTAALGDKAAAEAEYIDFMKRFPDSPLMSGAIQRISRMHGGNLSPAAKAVWDHNEQVASAKAFQDMRSRSFCGPKCLAELLKRNGKPADVKELADECKTSLAGTTLASLAKVAGKHGLQVKGVSLTQRGLAEQKLPLVAFVSPGHYVIVDSVTPQQVVIWDPGMDYSQPSQKTYALADWSKIWAGTAMTVQPSGATQLAHR